MKQFILVLFGFVFSSGIAWSQNVCSTKKNSSIVNSSTCSECCEENYNVIIKNPVKDATGQVSYTDGINPMYATCNSYCTTTFGNKSEGKQECSSALEKYDKAKKQNPCPTASTSKECYDKIESCRASTGIVGTNSLATGDENMDGLANSVLEMIMASKAQKQNTANDMSANRSCYSAIQVRDKDASEKRKTRTDQIVKDIEAADKERREANEKLGKETSEVENDRQKLQEESEKTLIGLEEKQAEKIKKTNDDIQKAGVDIRNKTTEIIKIKQSMERLKFENQKAMVAYTEEKISQQCKSALDTAKTCFVKASKGAKFAKEDTCSNFTFSGSGTKGTAELKKKLKQVREACFEQSNQTVASLKYDYADKVRNFEMDIKEKQEQIGTSNTTLETSRKEIEDNAKSSEKQKSQAQKNLEQHQANFAKKLANLEKSTNAAVLSSETKINRLNLELKDLKAGATASEVSDPGSQSIYDNIANDANVALDEISGATSIAFGACCNVEKVKSKDVVTAKTGNSAICTKLYHYSNEDKRSSSRSRSKAKAIN